jgi:hypothetical protein
MARYKDKERALQLRKEGKSYSEIKDILKVGKGTLSAWLGHMPLTKEQMSLVRDWNPRRIESYRATVHKRREALMLRSYQKVSNDIGILSKRELFLAGLFLYWGEGTKSTRGTVGLSNTDPTMIRFFLRWLDLMGVERKKIRIKLHVYSDMDASVEIRIWSRELGIPLSQFGKTYVKTSAMSGLTYRKGFGHGTCNVLFCNMALWRYIMGALKYLGEPSKGA